MLSNTVRILRLSQGKQSRSSSSLSSFDHLMLELAGGELAQRVVDFINENFMLRPEAGKLRLTLEAGGAMRTVHSQVEESELRRQADLRYLEYANGRHHVVVPTLEEMQEGES